MRNAIKIMLFLLYSAGVFCQNSEFAPIGAEWVFANNTETTYRCIGMDSIGGVECSVVAKYGTGACIVDSDTFYFHDEGGKVSFYKDDNFYSLYDFSAVEGDTFRMHSQFNPENIYSDILIDSVVIIDLDGVPLKIQHVSQIAIFAEPIEVGGLIFENIGMNNYIFPPYAVCDPIYGPPLNCYTNNDDINISIPSGLNQYPVVNTGLGCPTTSLKNYNILEKVEVLPNAASDMIRIRLMKDVDIDIFIYNSEGVLSREIKGYKTDDIIDISSLAKGIYFISVADKQNNAFGNSKFIKI